MPKWHDVADAVDVKEDEIFVGVVQGLQIALFNLGGEVFALEDLCSHGGARLSDGYVDGGCVECPLHQGLIDIRTGNPCLAPITEPVRSFPVRVSGSRIEIEL